MSAAARWAPRIAFAIERCRFAALPPSPWVSCLTLSRLPMMIIRRLLKSWAMPPLSWPTASMPLGHGELLLSLAQDTLRLHSLSDVPRDLRESDDFSVVVADRIDD